MEGLVAEALDDELRRDAAGRFVDGMMPGDRVIRRIRRRVQRSEGETFAAGLGVSGRLQRIRTRADVGITVRLGEDLGDEQRQRQPDAYQVLSASAQDTDLRRRAILARSIPGQRAAVTPSPPPGA